MATIGISLLPPSAPAQLPNKTPRPTFEAASVKPVQSGSLKLINTPPGRFFATGQSLKSLIMFAYGMRDYQVVGGPNWVERDLWEIQATISEGNLPPKRAVATPGLDSTNLMLQSLLEERFHLRFHLESRLFPTYELVVANGGAKITPSKDQTVPEPSTDIVSLDALSKSQHYIRTTRGRITGRGVPISFLVTTLSANVNRPIADKTNLTGLYDFDLEWTPDTSPGVGPAGATFDAPGANQDIGATSILSAIQEKLGLQIKASKGPLDVIVIENAAHPDEN
jgi:uncharacterized protein (TIGR03435 family)